MNKPVYFNLIILLISPLIYADSAFIDKIYHPYVQSHERELEWRFLLQNGDKNPLLDDVIRHKFAYGQSISENLFAEFYLVTERNKQQRFKLTTFEIETLWQITEQGEYAVDWGILFEFEHEIDQDISEISSALLLEKQWGKWNTTANIYFIYEWGKRLDNEFETAISMQGKYRYSKQFEPAIEYYKSEFNQGLGAVFLGALKLSGRQKLKWETGVIWGMDKQTPDVTYKFLIEFEF